MTHTGPTPPQRALRPLLPERALNDDPAGACPCRCPRRRLPLPLPSTVRRTQRPRTTGRPRLAAGGRSPPPAEPKSARGAHEDGRSAEGDRAGDGRRTTAPSLLAALQSPTWTPTLCTRRSTPSDRQGGGARYVGLSGKRRARMFVKGCKGGFAVALTPRPGTASHVTPQGRNQHAKRIRR